jgi:hypothetical protein
MWKLKIAVCWDERTIQQKTSWIYMIKINKTFLHILVFFCTTFVSVSIHDGIAGLDT